MGISYNLPRGPALSASFAAICERDVSTCFSIIAFLAYLSYTGYRSGQEMTHCLSNTHRQSPPSKEVASTYELTARDASPCAVLRQRSQSRQTFRSQKTPARLVPICNRTSAAAFTHASGSRAFGAAPSTTASARGKRFPRSPSQDETGGRSL